MSGFSHIFRFGIPVFTCTYLIASNGIIYNETKRNFYGEDEEHTIPIPGTTTPASKSELEVMGPKLVEGVSVRSPSSIESFFKSIRRESIGYYQSFENKLNYLSSRYYQTERDVTSTVSELHERNEDLLPNSIYILIASLSGNILARQRGVVARITFPAVLGLSAFKIFLPQTFSNTTNFVWKLEQKNLPSLAKQQEIAYNKANEIVKDVEKTAESSKLRVESSVSSVKKSIADMTGLNLDEEVSKRK